MQINKEISLGELINIIWSKKFIIVFFIFISACTSVFYSLSLPNMYTSKVLLAPTGESNSPQGFLNQYSSLASFGGISLDQGSINKSKEALARIKSYEFFSLIFIPSINYEDLVAVKEWDSSTNTLKYDEKVYDNKLKDWKNESSLKKSLIPSYQDAYKTYISLLSINTNDKDGLIEISITHHSPDIARIWLNIIIKGINNTMRDEEKMKASKSVDFLNKQASYTNYEEIKKVLLSLQQEQMKSLMLIEANEDFVFRVLDSPISPEVKSGPRRSIIVILGSLFGLIFSSMLILLNFYYVNYQLKS